jgi:hypothetical protein
MTGRPPSLHRLLQGGVRRLRRYYEDAPTPAVRPATLRCSRGGTIEASWGSLPPSQGASSGGLGRWGSAAPGPTWFAMESSRSLRFLGNPRVCSPCSRTPAGSPPPGRYGGGTRPTRSLTPWAPAIISISGLNSTAFTLAVYASQPGSPQSTQDSLPVVGQTLPGGIGYPQGSDERFPIRFVRLFPLSQASPDAITTKLSGPAPVTSPAPRTLWPGPLQRRVGRTRRRAWPPRPPRTGTAPNRSP